MGLYPLNLALCMVFFSLHYVYSPVWAVFCCLLSLSCFLHFFKFLHISSVYRRDTKSYGLVSIGWGYSDFIILLCNMTLVKVYCSWWEMHNELRFIISLNQHFCVLPLKRLWHDQAVVYSFCRRHLLLAKSSMSHSVLNALWWGGCLEFFASWMHWACGQL